MPSGFRAEVEIDFANPVIGHQIFSLELSAEGFRREVARARTFGCMNDVARLWSAGFALGASFENSVGVRRGAAAQSGRPALCR